MSPVLIALDDIQWLDASSASALTFVARRLEGTEIRFLLARRPGPASPLELALDPRGVERLELGPLSLGAIRRLLRERLGLSVSRQLLRRIYDATLGNALFALEVGRKLVDEGPPGIGEDLPVPDAVEDLLGLRVDRLPEGVRRLLLAVALSPDLRVGQLDVLADPETLDLAVASGVLVVTGDHVRASHPLLAAAVVERADAAERRELHRRLAAAVGDEELGARHRALAAARPDAGSRPTSPPRRLGPTSAGHRRPRSSSQITPSASRHATIRIVASASSGSRATSSSPVRSSG